MSKFSERNSSFKYFLVFLSFCGLINLIKWLTYFSLGSCIGAGDFQLGKIEVLRDHRADDIRVNIFGIPTYCANQREVDTHVLDH